MGDERGALEPKGLSRRSAEAAGESTIRAAVARALDEYFRELDGHDCNGLYRLVMREVEVPLLQSVLGYTEGNQTRAARLLGLNRATLRKKLRDNGLVNNHE